MSGSYYYCIYFAATAVVTAAVVGRGCHHIRTILWVKMSKYPSQVKDTNSSRLLSWCHLLSYRGKRSIDYPAQGKPLLTRLPRKPKTHNSSCTYLPAIFSIICLVQQYQVVSIFIFKGSITDAVDVEVNLFPDPSLNEMRCCTSMSLLELL